jgi:hypothetical protein
LPQEDQRLGSPELDQIFQESFYAYHDGGELLRYYSWLFFQPFHRRAVAERSLSVVRLNFSVQSAHHVHLLTNEHLFFAAPLRRAGDACAFYIQAQSTSGDSWMKILSSIPFGKNQRIPTWKAFLTYRH